MRAEQRMTVSQMITMAIGLRIMLRHRGHEVPSRDLLDALAMSCGWPSWREWERIEGVRDAPEDDMAFETLHQSLIRTGSNKERKSQV